MVVELNEQTLHKEFDWQAIWPIITLNPPSSSTNKSGRRADERRWTWTWVMKTEIIRVCFHGWNKIPSDVHSCLFRALSKCDKMIGSHAPLELRQFVKTHEMLFIVWFLKNVQIWELRQLFHTRPVTCSVLSVCMLSVSSAPRCIFHCVRTLCSVRMAWHVGRSNSN